MKNDIDNRNTNIWNATWCMHGNSTDSTSVQHSRSNHVSEVCEEMPETRKARIKRLITAAHVRFIASQQVGSELFWDLALSDINAKTLYDEFANLELSQIIESYTKEK